MGEKSEQPTQVMQQRRWWSNKPQPRELEDLAHDPALLFNASYLSSSASWLAFWLMSRTEPVSPEECKLMGERLARDGAWFYETEIPEKGRK